MSESTDDPMNETIRGNDADKPWLNSGSGIGWGPHDADWNSNIAWSADVTLFMADFSPEAIRDLFTRVGFGTCHIQGPDGKMRLVSVSVVRPAQPAPKSNAPKFEPGRWSDMDFERMVLSGGYYKKIVDRVNAVSDMPEHVRNWFIKQCSFNSGVPDDELPTRTKLLLDVAERMAKGEPPFVDSAGKPVAWSYLDDNGWPRLANGRLVDVPIVPTQALRDDRNQSEVSSLISAHKALSKRMAEGGLDSAGAISRNYQAARIMAEDVASRPLPGTRFVNWLRRVRDGWVEFWETPPDPPRWD